MKWSMGNPSQSCDHAMTSRHVTPKGQTRDQNTMRAQYILKQLG